MVSLVPPGSGLEQTKDRDPTPVIPRWDSRSLMSRGRRATRVGSPYSPDFPKSTIAAGPRTTHYAAQGRKANIVFSLEMEREEGEGGVGLGRHLSAAARLRMHSTTAQSFSEVLQQ